MQSPKNLEWLRKQAKRHLEELRKTNPDATLADAQLAIARENGFSNWRALKAHVDGLSVDGQLFDAAGHGDDHEMEIIGWATCWDGTDDDAHHAVVDFLLSRGARHHIFSAIAQNLAAEVRRIVGANPSTLTTRMSRNENHQTPLHFAVRHKRPHMVALLIELGADPLVADGFGYPPAMYAESPEIDRPVMEAIRALTAGELLSADRGH